MTGDYSGTGISSRNIRIIVLITGLDGQAAADVSITHLQQWLDGLETLTSSPMAKWTGGGAMVAAELFRVALEAGEHMVACLAATWIALYGCGSPPGFGLSLDDLREAAG
jgi:hypothetical protein